MLNLEKFLISVAGDQWVVLLYKCNFSFLSRSYWNNDWPAGIMTAPENSAKGWADILAAHVVEQTKWIVYYLHLGKCKKDQ